MDKYKKICDDLKQFVPKNQYEKVIFLNVLLKELHPVDKEGFRRLEIGPRKRQTMMRRRIVNLMEHAIDNDDVAVIEYIKRANCINKIYNLNFEILIRKCMINRKANVFRSLFPVYVWSIRNSRMYKDEIVRMVNECVINITNADIIARDLQDDNANRIKIFKSIIAFLIKNKMQVKPFSYTNILRMSLMAQDIKTRILFTDTILKYSSLLDASYTHLEKFAFLLYRNCSLYRGSIPNGMRYIQEKVYDRVDDDEVSIYCLRK
jgi:hypothetical protein